MRKISCLLGVLLFSLAATTSKSPAKSRSKVCSVQLRSRTVSYLTSHAQPIYQPYLTLCPGHRLCSTYRTIYRTAQRLAYRKLPQPTFLCCPGGRRGNGSPSRGCYSHRNTPTCQPPCQNGGRCASHSKCSCPAGWTGRRCETDVDECAGGTHTCSQLCLNTAGSFRCGCQQGYELHTDGKTCLVLEEPPPAPEGPEKATPRGPSALAPHVCFPLVSKSPQALEEEEEDQPMPTAVHYYFWYALCPSNSYPGAPDVMMQDEVRELKSRIAALEEKFELNLAPFLKLELPGTEGTVTNAIGLLVLSLQQLDRIDSLSEQISFLEERLETCSCKKER